MTVARLVEELMFLFGVVGGIYHEAKLVVLVLSRYWRVWAECGAGKQVRKSVSLVNLLRVTRRLKMMGSVCFLGDYGAS